MATFLSLRGHVQLSALCNPDDGGRLVTRSLLNILDLVDNVVSLEDLPENDMAAIEPAAELLAHVSISLYKCFRYIPGNDGGDEELRPVGVLSGVGHAYYGPSISDPPSQQND